MYTQIESCELERTKTKLININKEFSVLCNQVEKLKEKNITLWTYTIVSVVVIVTLICKIILNGYQLS